MKPVMNLHIITEKFWRLSNSSYFDPCLREFFQTVASAAKRVLDNQDKYPEDTIRKLGDDMWQVVKFIQGSRAKDAPHETLYVLRKALSQWMPNAKVIISSAALDDLEFSLESCSISKFIPEIIHEFGDQENTPENIPTVVGIGSPEVFKHRPIFCSPLFHELGHFIDNAFKISERSMMLSGQDMDQDRYSIQLHWAEYFADIFGACYCGRSIIESLSALVPDNPETPTHPSTLHRVQIINDFLSGNNNPVIEMLQESCFIQTGEKLEVEFKSPSLKEYFDDITTYRISDEKELFGIFSAGWDYLFEQINNKSAPWIAPDMSIPRIEEVVNGLVEKSIRNFEIRERWENDSSE